MWWFKRQPTHDDFPEGFRVQRIGVAGAKALAELPPGEIASYFREHPDLAKDLLIECSDKRYTPSTVISGEGNDFTVGWFSRSPATKRYSRTCVRRFSNLADAATDYLLFSRGKGRWNPPGDGL
jgi:hypothetical protein